MLIVLLSLLAIPNYSLNFNQLGVFVAIGLLINSIFSLIPILSIRKENLAVLKEETVK